MGQALSDKLWDAIHTFTQVTKPFPKVGRTFAVVMSKQTHARLIREFAETNSVWWEDLKYHPDRIESMKVFGAKVFLSENIVDDKFYIMQGQEYPGY